MVLMERNLRAVRTYEYVTYEYVTYERTYEQIKAKIIKNLKVKNKWY